MNISKPNLYKYENDTHTLEGKYLRLYMYVTPNALNEILKTKKIKISLPWRTNDVTEGVYAGETYQDGKILNYGYICFSSTCSSPSMWGYYADRSRGACLVFDLEVIDSSNPLFFYLLDDGLMEYGKQVYIAPVAYEEYRIDNNKKTSVPNIIKVLYAKSKTWEHEKEYRAVFELKKQENNDIQLIDINGSLVANYFDSTIFKALSGIILGAKFACSEADINAILRKQGLEDRIAVTRAVFSPEKFSFFIDESHIKSRCNKIESDFFRRNYTWEKKKELPFYNFPLCDQNARLSHIYVASLSEKEEIYLVNNEKKDEYILLLYNWKDNIIKRVFNIKQEKLQTLFDEIEDNYYRLLMPRKEKNELEKMIEKAIADLEREESENK